MSFKNSASEQHGYSLLAEQSDDVYHDALRKLRLYRIALFIIIVLDLVIGLAWIFHQKRPLDFLHPSQQLLPQIPKYLVTFQEDLRYDDGDPFRPEGSSWLDLIPEGKGKIVVKDPAKWKISGGYPIPEHGTGAEEYSISMFHQIHCLASLKSSFESMMNSKRGAAHSDHRPSESQGHEHLNHCFDYLRQSIMCAGDTTLEKARVVDNTIRRDTLGWGATHECRDYGAIYKFAYENRARNVTGIS